MYNQISRNVVALAGAIALGPMFFNSSGHAQPATEAVLIGNARVQCAPPTVNLKGVDADRWHNGKFGPQPNNEWAAAIVAPFAAASYDVYEEVRPGPTSRALRLDDGNADLAGEYGQSGWTRWTAWGTNGRTENPNNGLVYDVYFRDNSPDRLELMVAYRGTDTSTIRDRAKDWWYGNGSWLTQWFTHGQYQQAQEEYPRIIEQAQAELAKGRPMAITTTGHSLGGGLARHVAEHFRCTSTVVFNSSFVTNNLRAQHTPPVQVYVYRVGDRFEKLIPIVVNTPANATYRLPVTKSNYLHSMEWIAAEAARTVLTCDLRNAGGKNECEAPSVAIAVARTLFCDRYVKYRYLHAPPPEKGKDNPVAGMKDPEICPTHKALK